MNIVFSLLAKIRNPNLFKIYNYQKLLEKSDDLIIENIKKSKLRSLLIHANENTKFWNSKFNNENINPYSKYPFEELKKIIPITKDDLINNNEFIQNFIKGEKHFKASTSGTSGKKLVFLKNEKWDSANRASIFQGYSWNNCSPNNFKIYFWGLNLNFITKVKTRFLDFLQNRYRIFSYDLKDFDKVSSKKDKIEIIEGYSSSIYEFSKYVIKHKIIFPNLKMIKATSETIQDEYIISVKKAFGLNLISEYGSAEAGIISFSCEKGNMHVNELNVIVEESSKEIIVTNLNSHSFPIIKYVQGDYIDYNTKKICSCGLKSKVINKVYGRVGAIIQGHKSFYGSLLLYNVFKNINAKNKLSLAYHAKQFEKGKIEIYIDRTQLNNRNIDLICKEFKLYCDRDLDIILKEQKTKNKTKKTKDFESYL